MLGSRDEHPAFLVSAGVIPRRWKGYRGSEGPRPDWPAVRLGVRPSLQSAGHRWSRRSSRALASDQPRPAHRNDPATTSSLA